MICRFVDVISAHDISQGFAVNKVLSQSSLLFEFPIQEGKCKKNERNVSFLTFSATVLGHCLENHKKLQWLK